MRWSERRTAVRSTFEGDFHTSTPSDAHSRPPSLILVSLDDEHHEIRRIPYSASRDHRLFPDAEGPLSRGASL